MALVRDGANREWLVSINLGTVKRVKDATGHNLAAVLDNRFAALATITSDMLEFVNVLWWILEPQATAKGVTQEAFLESWAGESIDSALTGFVEALGDFFPPRQRSILQATWTKVRTSTDRMAAKAVLEIEAMDLETGLQSPSNSPELSASSLGS